MIALIALGALCLTLGALSSAVALIFIVVRASVRRLYRSTDVGSRELACERPVGSFEECQEFLHIVQMEWPDR
ncbi:MAG: hypothetical protein O2789_02220 [Actinomycetota bacterium]|nr:hypothetical protein [Actinomycetota bacterium]